MKLFTVFWTYGEHEMENEVFASETGTAADGRAYLLNVYGGEGEYMDDLKQLKDVSVHPFETVHTSDGAPYKVVLKEG